MNAQLTESRAEYDQPLAHPWFERTDFDWMLEAVTIACLALGALALLF